MPNLNPSRPARPPCLVDTLAVVECATVYHVGDLASPPGPRDYSYEGPGVSVSRTPDAWRRIARLGGAPTWRLTRRDGQRGRFVDVRAFTTTHRAQLTRLAIAHGLLAPTMVFAAEWYDDEMEDRMRVRTTDLEDALAHVGAGGSTPALQLRVEAARQALAAGAVSVRLVGPPEPPPGVHRATPDDEIRVFAIAGTTPTDTLQAWWMATFRTPLDAASAEEAAWLYLLHTATGAPPIDGAWWRDRLDPVRLSAPRGVIFPARLTAWQWVIADDGVPDTMLGDGTLPDEGEDEGEDEDEDEDE